VSINDIYIFILSGKLYLADNDSTMIEGWKKEQATLAMKWGAAGITTFSRSKCIS
jgi:hypothetical protein